jgi:hypothetical protein
LSSIISEILCRGAEIRKLIARPDSCRTRTPRREEQGQLTIVAHATHVALYITDVPRFSPSSHFR